VRSAVRPAPATMDVFDKVDDEGEEAAKDSLTRDDERGGLLFGKFANIPLPASPTGPLKLFFDDKAFEDVWVAVRWGS
jgi:hypothetical protein